MARHRSRPKPGAGRRVGMRGPHLAPGRHRGQHAFRDGILPVEERLLAFLDDVVPAEEHLLAFLDGLALEGEDEPILPGSGATLE